MSIDASIAKLFFQAKASLDKWSAQFGPHRAIEVRRAQLVAWAQPFVREELFISADASSLIGFDFANKELFLADATTSGKYNFNEIASCELISDAISLTQTNRRSQLLGVAVGEVLLGPVGALAGALSASTRTRSRLSTLELKLVVDCKRSPVYRVVLFRALNKNGVPSNHRRLLPLLKNVDRIHGHVVNAIRNSENEYRWTLANKGEARSANMGSPSLSDLRELFELKQLGAISEEEYARAKTNTLVLQQSTGKGSNASEI